MVNVKVNNDKVFQVNSSIKDVEVDGTILDLDVRALGADCFNVLYNSKSYNVEVVEMENGKKHARIKVNGQIYAIDVEDKFDQLLKQMGLDKLVQNKISEIKAPMPGLVLAVKVKEGDVVSKGESLVILEAMKMENIIKSPVDGVIKKVVVIQGATVEKNQSLLVFE